MPRMGVRFQSGRLSATGRYRPVNVLMKNTAGDSFVVRRTMSFESKLRSEQRSLVCAIYARIYAALLAIGAQRTILHEGKASERHGLDAAGVVGRWE
jgi:hypothetical protein